MRQKTLIAVLLGLIASTAVAAPQVIVSPVNKVGLLELYTSEGCDSCPPAEKWISTLQGDDRLWKQLVPVTFHVDYWDYLGWRDPFDSHTYTERQQAIAARADGLAGRIIATPQFVLDGKYWPNWLEGKPLQLDDRPKIGVLSLSDDGRTVGVRFAPAQKRSQNLEAHVVLLAFGVDEAVGAGENKGVTLRHDFLVVADTHGALRLGKDGSYVADVSLPKPVAVKATRYALAGWVSSVQDPMPIQAVGGWLATRP